MASPLHWGKPEQWSVTPIDIVVTAKNRGHKMVKWSQNGQAVKEYYSCWSRTKFGLSHAVKMQLMIVEFVIFSTCTVKWSRAFLRFSDKNNGLSCEYSIGGSDIPFLSA